MLTQKQEIKITRIRAYAMNDYRFLRPTFCGSLKVGVDDLYCIQNSLTMTKASSWRLKYSDPNTDMMTGLLTISPMIRPLLRTTLSPDKWTISYPFSNTLPLYKKQTHADFINKKRELRAEQKQTKSTEKQEVVHLLLVKSSYICLLYTSRCV